MGARVGIKLGTWQLGICDPVGERVGAKVFVGGGVDDGAGVGISVGAKLSYHAIVLSYCDAAMTSISPSPSMSIENTDFVM